MSRDYKKLKAFHSVDELVLEVYRITKTFPKSETFGMTSQLRRASVSAAANIVEGSHRRTKADYLHFLQIALGSLAETGYLIDLSRRLGYLDEKDTNSVLDIQGNSIRLLNGLISSLRKRV